MARPTGDEYIKSVMGEYKRGGLRNYVGPNKEGDIVTDDDQAIAIALREREQGLGIGAYANPSPRIGMYKGAQGQRQYAKEHAKRIDYRKIKPNGTTGSW